MGRKRQATISSLPTLDPDDDADFMTTPTSALPVSEEELDSEDVQLALAISASLNPSTQGRDGRGLRAWIDGRGTRIIGANSAQSIILERILQDVVQWSDWVESTSTSAPATTTMTTKTTILPSLWSMTSDARITPSPSFLPALTGPWSKALEDESCI